MGGREKRDSSTITHSKSDLLSGEEGEGEEERRGDKKREG